MADLIVQSRMSTFNALISNGQTDSLQCVQAYIRTLHQPDAQTLDDFLQRLKQTRPNPTIVQMHDLLPHIQKLFERIMPADANHPWCDQLQYALSHATYEDRNFIAPLMQAFLSHAPTDDRYAPVFRHIFGDVCHGYWNYNALQNCLAEIIMFAPKEPYLLNYIRDKFWQGAYEKHFRARVFRAFADLNPPLSCIKTLIRSLIKKDVTEKIRLFVGQLLKATQCALTFDQGAFTLYATSGEVQFTSAYEPKQPEIQSMSPAFPQDHESPQTKKIDPQTLLYMAL